jgi:predicted Fe-S protein YdhL (DUF1289 family)
MDPLESPCIGVCTIAKSSGLCRGCRRTIEEIARWRAMDKAERARVLAACDTRPIPAD